MSPVFRSLRSRARTTRSPTPIVAGTVLGAGRATRFSIVAVIAFAAVQLVPLLPALLFDVPAPRPAIVITASSLLVMSALFLNEWWFKPRARFGLFRALAISFGVALTLGALGGTAGLILTEHLRGELPPRPMPPPPLDIPIYAAAVMGAVTSIFQVGLWAIAFVVPATAEDERVRTLEIQNLRLEANELRTQAELVRLRGQLEPHFLLNTLNLVSGLVTSDPHGARNVLSILGELLSDALSESRELSSVAEELSWLRRYVEILTARHGDLLQVSWEVRDHAERALLPRLLLQPLVENAVRHGALRKADGGRVTIRAERQVIDGRDCLVCSVRDDGPGMGEPRDGAIGLENVRRRIALSQPYGELDIHSDRRGTTARVILPFVEDSAYRTASLRLELS